MAALKTAGVNPFSDLSAVFYSAAVSAKHCNNIKKN
jgi:hypothetical protein